MNEEQWRAAWRICEAASELPSTELKSALELSNDPEVAAQVRAVLGEDEPDPASEQELAFPEPGSYVGRYVLKQVVGRGGIGQVYSAHDVELGRTVALKFLYRRVSLTESIEEQFVKEAQAASALNHPNIVTVHEVVRWPGGLAIVMELIEGMSLRQRLNSVPLSVDEVLRLGHQMAEALATAHARQIVHRDIKPENMMVRPDGYIKILDFGLARMVPLTTKPSGRTAALTNLAGTWRYMSPEQRRGEPLSPATDIFSLGLVLYEMCTGTHPFPAESSGSAEAIPILFPQRPSVYNPRIPFGLDQVILAMLDERPAARPSADHVARMLKESLDETVALQERKRGGRLVLVAVLFLLCVRATIMISQYVSDHRQPILTRITNNESENRVTAAAISSDGAMIAYADPDGVFVRSIRTSDTRPLRCPAHLRVNRLAWFADYKCLLISGFNASALDSSLWMIPTTNTDPVLVREGAGNGVASPDGKHIAFTANNESDIWVSDLAGRNARRIISGFESDVFPVLFWSADGNRISFQRRTYRPKPTVSPVVPDEFEGNYEFSYESADAVSGRILTVSRNTALRSACALRDGRVLFVRWGLPVDRWTENLWSVKTDRASGAFLDTPRQITHLGPSSKAFGLTASADGRLMAAILESTEADVYIGDLEQPGPRLVNSKRLTLNSKADYPHGWTPDGKSVIFESDRGGNSDIFKQAIDARVAESITTESTDDVFPQLTPDGRWILYGAAAVPDAFWTRWTLMRVPIEGGTSRKLFDGEEKLQFRCPHYGTGACVLREAVGHREFVFFQLDPIKGKGRELARVTWTPSFLGDWDISPDGTMIAMPDHNVPYARIRLVRLDGTGVLQPERNVETPAFSTLRSVAWAAAGNGWFGAAQTQIGDDLIYIDLSGHANLLHETSGNTWAVPSPDGRHLAFVDYGVDSNVWTLQRF